MGIESFKKTFSDIGKMEFKIASTRDELEQALRLVYKEYHKRGFIDQKYYKSRLRVTTSHIVPGTVTFIGKLKGEVVITNTVIPDSVFGLPMDVCYKDEVDKLRGQKRKVCEVGYLAIKSGIFESGFFSLFNFNKLDFVFTIFKMIFQYVMFHERMDDICIVTNPKYMMFRFLPFEIIGEVKYYGYDRIALKRKAAVPKRLDIAKMRKHIENPDSIGIKKSLQKIFLGDIIPASVFNEKMQYSFEDLFYFFVKKSNVLKRLNKDEVKQFISWYGLDRKVFDRLLKKKS